MKRASGRLIKYRYPPCREIIENLAAVRQREQAGRRCEDHGHRDSKDQALADRRMGDRAGTLLDPVEHRIEAAELHLARVEHRPAQACDDDHADNVT